MCDCVRFKIQVISNSNRLKMASSQHSLSHSTTNPIRFSPTHQSPFFLKTPQFSFPKSPTFNLKIPLISKNPSILTPKASKFTAKSSMAEQVKSSNVNIFDSEEQVAIELAKYTANLSDKFVKERGAFTVVVSGGSLIKSLRKLVEPPYVDSIDWSRWHMFWVDERVVPKDHPDCNYKLAYDGFLSKVPIPPGQVYAINDSLSAAPSADDYETCLKQLVKTTILAASPANGFPKFDVMLLGMGPDGHVASLFPGHPLVKENQRWVTYIKDSPKPPPERITFTFPVINSSANVALVVCGSGKAAVVKTALSGNQSSDLLPVQMVSPEGELMWFVDKEAAGML